MKNSTTPVFPGPIISYTFSKNCIKFYTGKTLFKVTVLSDKVIHFRFANDSTAEDYFSYAIKDLENFRVEFMDFYEETERFVILTKQLKCFVNKDNCCVSILDREGNKIVEDEKGFHWIEDILNGGEIVLNSKRMLGDENFYGLGDKSDDLNLRGKQFQIWGSDTHGFSQNTDPLYKNFPFFLCLHQQTAYGIFFDNSFKSFFDFGYERKDVFCFGAQGGEMDYYFIYGPKLQTVAEEYTKLTGLPELPPLWSLGYHQSKWSYYPESAVRELAGKFRKRKIPCDAIHLDIDYMNGYRCFTWNHEHFPDPKKMIEDLGKEGFKIVTIINPGIKIDKEYWVYKEGIEKNMFCKRTDGPLYKGSVWPGLCHFPDFTNPVVREWWAGLIERLIEKGVKGIWNDMNEPTAFEEGTFPSDVRHDYDGHPCSHRKAHNIYGYQMAKASFEGLRRSQKDLRPFNLTRSAYSGIQRYSAVWTGDNVASWEHIRLANIQCQRLSISGVSFSGSDIGGFVEKSEGELYTRWIQMAIFHPFFRTHTSGDYGEKEPWTYGPVYEAIIKSYIELRYQLLPYIYTTFWQYTVYGTPMIRSLHLLDQEDQRTYNQQDEFGFGDHILVCPITQPNADGRWVYLPKNGWYNFWDDTFYGDSGDIYVETPLNKLPVFVKAGAVLLFNPVTQYVGELVTEKVALHIYFIEGFSKCQIYEDAGDGYEYKKGEYVLRDFEIEGTGNEFHLSQRKEGNFKVSYRFFEVVIHGFLPRVKTCKSDGQEIPYAQNEYFTKFTIDENFNNITIRKHLSSKG